MKKTYQLDGLDCANCATKLEEKISKISGVKSVTINFFTLKMQLEIENTNSEQILKNVFDICKKEEPELVIEEE